MAEFALPAPKDYDPDTGLPIPPKAPAPRAAISDYAKSLASGVVNTNLTAPGQLSVLAGGSPEQRAHGQDIERRLLESMSPEGAQVASNKVVNPDFTIGETPIQSVLMSAAQSLPSMVQAVQFGAPIARAAAQARVGERVTAGLGSMPGAATIGRLAENAPFGVIEGVQAGAQNAAQVGQQIRDANQTPDETIAQSPEFQRALIESINAHPELPAQDHIKAARDAVAAAAERDVFGKTVPVTGGIGVLTGGGVLPRAARPFTGASREAGETLLKSIGRGAREEAGQEFLQSGAEQMVQNAAVQKYANPEQSLTDDVLNQAVTGAAAGGLMGAGGGAIGALPQRRRPQDVLADPNAGTLDRATAAGQLSGAIPTAPDGEPMDQPPPGGAPGEPAGTPSSTPPAGPSDADIERARREDEEHPPRNWVEAGTPDPFEHLTQEDKDSAYDEAYFQLANELAPQGIDPTDEQIRERQVQILTDLLLERAAAASGTPSSTGAGNGERQGQEAPASEVLNPPAGATPKGEAPAGAETGPRGGAGTPADTTGPQGVAPRGGGTIPGSIGNVGEIALEEQRKAGWDTNWPFVPADLGNADFRAQIANDPSLSSEEKARIFDAGKKLGVVSESEGTIDEGAHGAATSPRNELPEPTEGQKDAGNYQKGHIRVSGLDVSIENPSGSTRSGTDESGKPWSTTMVDHYGYIKRTEGADSTEAKRQGVDAFVKSGTAQDHEGPVFIVDQTKPDGTFDEHKVMLGYTSRADALRGYLRHYEKGWNHYNFVTRMEPNEFRAWVMDKEATKEPLSEVIQPEGQAPTGAQPPASGAPAGEQHGEPNAPTGTGTPPADVGQAPGSGVPEPTGGNSGGEAQSEPAGGGREVDSGEGGRGDGTGVPGDTGTAGSAPAGGNGAGVGPGTVTGDTPTEPKPPAEPKQPKPEVTSETPVGLGQARSHWNKNVPDEDKKGFENATFKTLAGVPHVIGADTAFHFVRSPANPKTLEVKEGYASEEARVQHEGKKANPLDVMIAQGDLHGLAAAAYAGVREPTQDDLPVVLADDRLVRFPIKLDEREAVEANLKKLKFRITDRAQESEKAERIMVSAIYRPDAGTIGDVGEQMGGGRKEQNPQPVIAKGADEKALDKFLADIAKANLINPESNPDRTFGAMMFKEGLLYFAKHPLDYIAKILKKQSFEFSEERSDRKVLLMALESPQWTTKVNGLAATYVERLTMLQGVIGPHANVPATALALREAYLRPNTDQLNAEGDKLSRVMTMPLNVYLEKYGPLFAANEESTDQTHRLVKKDPDSPPQLERIVRVGMKDHRGGKNIDAEADFKSTFGFRGVEFGNWVNQVERQDNLNLAYDSLLDMADIAGFDARSIGLNDALGLAIGARGRGGSAAAHFEPDNNVINLTKTKGNGTVGHEWGHALDHYNRDDDNSKKLISSVKDALRQRLMVDRIEDQMRAILRQADQTTNRNVPPKKALFSAVRSTRYQGNPGQLYYSVREDTRFFKDARAMDEGASERYWSTPHELFARGWETFLFDKSRGGTPYLVGPSRGDGVLTPENGYKGTPYPRRQEREYVSDLFKTMLEQLDPKTLRVKPYTVVARVEEIPEMGWVALDQHGASLVGDGFLYFYNTEADAKAAVAAQNGTERVLTIERLQYGQANQKIVPFLKDVDRIMEEMGIRLYPSVKNGSMAESMFFSLRQGWWPENNAALKTFAAQAHSIEPSAVDLLMLKQAQEDFEAALARYTAQIITDMRATGADDRAVYERMVEMYGKQPNLDVRTTTSAANQAHSTPLPIAFVSGLLARVTPSTKVLDATGGTGLLAVTANPKNTIFIELEPHRALNLRLMEYGKVIEGNALEKLDTEVKAQEADALLLNPPFGALDAPGKVQSWDGTTFELNKIDHLIAARSMRAMADNGRATIILGAHRQPGVVTSSDRYFLNWLYSNYNVADHFEIEGKLYARQGAGAPIRVLVVAGRKQTETGFPAGTAIDRVYDFDQLWSRYAQAHESSRDVVVGAGVKSDGARGADSGGSGVPAGDQGQGGTADREGGQRGGGSGPVAPGAGRGTPGGQRPGNAGAGTPADAGHRGDGSAGQPGAGATGEPGGRTGRDRGPTGPDAGGLSGLTGKQVDDIFDDVFGKERAPRKAGAKSGGTTTSGKRGTGTTSTEGRGKSVLDDIPGMSDILGDLERELKKGENPPDSPPALSRSAGEPFNTNEYARFKPYFERIWSKLRETISDIAERLRTFAQGVMQAFGKVIRPYARFFVDEVRQATEQTVGEKKPVIADVGGPNQTPYKGRSKGDQAGIYIPDSHAKFIERAFDNLEAEYGDIDDFVAKELGYDSPAQMHAGLSGYQVDALGLALGQLKTGNGFIIGDDTGVGKGRTAASIISWAKKNGKIPIFFSFKKDLYTDMYRDLTHIGRGDTKIMLTDGDARMLDLAGNVVVKNNNARAKAQIDHVIKNGELPPGIDAMFTTYYQVNKENARRQAIRKLVASGKAVLVMDEAHNAAGESGTGKFVMQLLTGYGLDGSATQDEMGNPPPEGWKAPPTVYLSATFAKRPANMPVYIRTNLRHAADTPGELVGMFASGGDVLQRIASEMLVESGSMIRRERSYVGVKFETVIDEENGPRDARAVDNVTSVLRQIVYADRAFAEWVNGDGEEVVSTLMPPMWAATSSGQKADVSMNKSLFTSVVHNYVGQLLLATKVQKGVELAVAALNRGEKPIFALQNTMEAALEDYTSTAGVSVDDEMPGFGWQAILQRGLQSSHRVTFKQGTGDKAPRVRVTVPLNLMPDVIRDEFARAQELIDAFKSELPGSPIDALRAEMSKYVVWRDANGNWSAGKEAPRGVEARPLNIVEVTGRQGAVDYSGAVPKYVLRKDPDNLDIIRGFQNGGVDAIILNSSGSTGISLHASVDAKDQRPRRMIVLQANPDIAVFKQTLGRTNRTGQVEWPSFSVLGTAIPAERRLLAVLKKKIGTLFSNTSGGEGTTAIDAVDFINQYGDVITNQYLQDNKDIAAFIGVKLNDDPIDAMGSDVALTASGRAALLTVDEQEAFFDTIEGNFQQEIEMRNLTGTNALARRELDLQADPKWIGVLEEGMDEANPFTATANIVQYEVNVVGDIPTPEKVRDAIASSLKGRSASEVVDAFVDSMKTKYDEANNQLMLKDQELQKKIDDPKATAKEKESLEARLASLRESINEMGARRERTIRFLKNGYAIGKGYDSFYVGDVESQAVVIAITQGKSTSKTGNPFSPSNVIIHFQRNVPNGRLAVPLSKLEFGSEIRAESPHYGDAPLDDWFSPRYVSGGRANRYIAVGNILRARKAVKNAGEILVHSLKGSTPDSPLLQNGILMPQSWNTQGLTGSDFTIRYVRAAVDYVALVLRQMYLNRFARNGDVDDKVAAGALEEIVKHEVQVPDGLPDQLLSGETLKGAGDKWWLSINRYGTPGIELIVSRKNAPELMKSKALANALGRDLVSRRGQSVATSPVVTGPERIRRVIEILAQAGAMTAPEHSSDFLREISKLHYQEELGRPAASRGAGTGMNKAAVEIAAAKITSRWANAPTVVVVESLQDPAVPERLRMEDARQRSQGAQGDPEGFFDAGTVYLVAPQMSSERDVRRVLFHEALGHYGLRGLYGKGLAHILDQIAVIRRAEVGRIAQKYGLDMNSATDRSIAAEEVLANMAQTNPQLGFVRRAIAAIRSWMRSVGLNLRLSDDEIVRDFILPARAFVTQGRNAVSPGLSPALSRQDVERAMRAGGDAIRNLRAGGYKSAWQRFKDTLAHRRDVGLTLLGRRQIAEVYGKLLPALHDYSNEMQKYDAEKNSVAADADELIGRWRRLPDRIRLADTMHGATLTGYDPDVSKTNPSMMTPEMLEVYDNWNRLSDDAKAVYRQARDMYAHHWLKVKHAIRARVERAEIDGKRKKAMLGKIEDEFTKQLSGVYFPLARFGSYVVTVRDEDGKTLAVVRAESLAEAREERDRLQRENPDADVSKIILAKEYNAARDSVSKAFIQDLYGVLETSMPAGEDVDQLKDAINQLYLTSLPDVSWAKHGLHRKGTPGFDSDARRAFANNMFHGSYYLAKLNHADVLSDYLRDMQEYVDEKRDDHEYDSVAAQQVIHEMHRRHDLTMNPPYNPLTERLTAAGFIYMLGASPASALVNLSQTPLVAYPMLGAEFGWGRASTELLKASREVLGAKNDLRSTLKGDELQAFAQAVRDGIIDITQAHDLAAVAEGRDSQLHGAMAPFMRAASFLFHHAERFNRQATFMAAYRMAVAKGQSSEAAFDTARRLTYASHFDYAQSNRPRVMMGSWSKVLFLFKQYGQNMAYTLARNAIESVRGATPEDRARALKTLSGLLVATGLSAGLMGLPMVTILLGLASLIGSTDDEPWDAEAALRNMLADALGKPAGEMLAHGLFRGILPGDISSRVGLDSLFVKDIDLTLDPNKVWQELVYAALGPVLSIGVNQAKGVADVLKGDYQRGIEEMLPKALADVLKAFRYGTKGVVDRSGVEIVKDATALELAAQALGFVPSRVKESYEGRRAVMGLERAITARHNELLAKFSKAVINHDDEARVEALREIQAFNEKQPANGITSRAMLQSIQNRMRRITESQNGIALPRKQRPLVAEGRFANAE